MKRWYTQSKLYTAGTWICLWLCLSVTACWQMHPQATMVCSGHSPLHLTLSFSLFSTEDAKKSLHCSLLHVPIVNFCHRHIAELTSFYSHTKDAFCRLWLFKDKVQHECQSVSHEGERRENNAKKHPAFFLLTFMQLWQLYKIVPKCAQTVPSALFSVYFEKATTVIYSSIYGLVTDINPHLRVCSKSGLSQLVSCIETIVSPTES